MNGRGPDRAIAAALWAAIAAGSVLLIASFSDLPRTLVVGAAILLLGSLALAVVSAVATSRRGGESIGRSLADGVRAAFGWIVAFLP